MNKNTKAICILSFVFTLVGSTLLAQVKSGITNFSMSGYVRGMSTMQDKPEPDINFIGTTSTKMGDSLLSDMLLTYSEQEIGKFLGHDLMPVSRIRAKSTPESMNGTLWIMETTTEKKAFKELGYDEIITLSCQINYRSMKTVKGTRMYTPNISLSIKVIGKEGKTIFKKNESLALKETQVSGELLEEVQGDGKIGIDFSNLRKVTLDTGADTQAKGVGAVQLLDWYKQVLGNALIK